MSAQRLCPECGLKVEAVERGHLYRSECAGCGWEEWGTFFPSDEVGLIINEKLRVLIQWRDGRVTPEQLVAARKLVPALDESLHRLLSESRRSSAYDAGLFPTAVARELQAKAPTHGLEVTLVPATTEGC